MKCFFPAILALILNYSSSFGQPGAMSARAAKNLEIAKGVSKMFGVKTEQS